LFDSHNEQIITVLRVDNSEQQGTLTHDTYIQRRIKTKAVSKLDTDANLRQEFFKMWFTPFSHRLTKGNAENATINQWHQILV